MAREIGCHNDRENRFIFQGPVDDKVQERAKENGESDGSHKCNNECPGAVQQRNLQQGGDEEKIDISPTIINSPWAKLTTSVAL
jgi:hypothetical protein